MTAVLVAGGAGYVGSHACKALAAAGHRPIVYDNLSTGHRAAVRWGDFVEGDLCDGETLRAVMRQYKIGAVMHFAASANVGESMRDPALYFRNNVANTLTLLTAMQEEGVKAIVFSSTCACYGTPLRLPLDETHGHDPVSPYGESKAMVERMLRWFGEIHGLRWLALRYFNAAGADPDGEIGEDHAPETHLIPLAIMTAMGRRPGLDILGTDYPTPDGTAIRDYVHVSDLAQAHLRGLDHLLDGGASMALNLGTGRGHSVREVVAAVEAQAGASLPIRLADRRPGDPPILVADPRRSAEVLQWRPQMSELAGIVETAWNWHIRRHNV
ncbi:UDP-glucose 4-epimerase GalE [Telmatospirillum sp. J64-1]|uniref:UDP-glucose 4-epimerase GalE n=1 Tax=Telmatospirillum sp. J64-1 TaxID=2502183 RepID=UPI00115DDB28|nr:UDP-glucose 4-epimerase GalE [Telmatospirillum sp. J64-1]